LREEQQEAGEEVIEGLGGFEVGEIGGEGGGDLGGSGLVELLVAGTIGGAHGGSAEAAALAIGELMETAGDWRAIGIALYVDGTVTGLRK